MIKKLVQYKKNKKGFTLVELIVVIAIIAILAAILLPKYFGFTDDARKAAAISEAKSIRTVEETYYSTHGTWPMITVNVATGSGATAIAANTVVHADTPFTADGTITLNAANDGSFTFAKNNGLVATNGWTATCTVDGVITAVKTPAPTPPTGG